MHGLSEDAPTLISSTMLLKANVLLARGEVDSLNIEKGGRK